MNFQIVTLGYSLKLQKQKEGNLIFKYLSKKSFTNSNTQSMFIKNKTEPWFVFSSVNGNAYCH
ncbi:hypothetical protein BJN41_14445 [Acinetobacter towneri]|uniref:Uncharacterized protein n=1 Tax=Acinetobacter towneri TaxID=202956 RepID=A0A1E8DYB8_9GAMM|nr:hypothetical protein BJN41_14445 [Acinetobacter towneri]